MALQHVNSNRDTSSLLRSILARFAPYLKNSMTNYCYTRASVTIAKLLNNSTCFGIHPDTIELSNNFKIIGDFSLSVVIRLTSRPEKGKQSFYKLPLV